MDKYLIMINQNTHEKVTLVDWWAIIQPSVLTTRVTNEFVGVDEDNNEYRGYAYSDDHMGDLHNQQMFLLKTNDNQYWYFVEMFDGYYKRKFFLPFVQLEQQTREFDKEWMKLVMQT